MDDYAGRVLADRYRLPLPPSDEYELVETRAFDTASGQEVLVRQLPLPEVVDAEVLDAAGLPSAARRTTGRAVRRSTDPAVRRAIEAAQAAAQVPDHPRLDQVFDVFAEDGSLWIVSELVAARPLAALLAERPLNPYRAAEIGSDVLMALRVLHAHGWTHRNITVRTVLICDDGRVVLTGLAAGAAEEALCGYVPTPQPDDEDAYGRPAVESGPTGPYVPPTASLPSAGPVGIAGPGRSSITRSSPSIRSGCRPRATQPVSWKPYDGRRTPTFTARAAPRSCGPHGPEPSLPTGRAPAPPHASARTGDRPGRVSRRKRRRAASFPSSAPASPTPAGYSRRAAGAPPPTTRTTTRATRRTTTGTASRTAATGATTATAVTEGRGRPAGGCT